MNNANLFLFLSVTIISMIILSQLHISYNQNYYSVLEKKPGIVYRELRRLNTGYVKRTIDLYIGVRDTPPYLVLGYNHQKEFIEYNKPEDTKESSEPHYIYSAN